MKIIHWNINSHANGNYQMPEFIVKEIISRTPELFCLTEYSSDCEWENSELKKSYQLFSTPHTEGQNDILIGIANKYEKIITVDCEIYDSNIGYKPNFLMVSFEVNGKKVAFIGYKCLVGMNSNASEYEDRALLFESLKRKIEDYNKEYDYIILVGDFNNARVLGKLSTPFEQLKEEYGKCIHSSYNLHLIKENLEQLNLKLIEQDSDDSTSFVCMGDTKLRLDHMFVSNEISKNAKTSFDWNFISKENGYIELPNEYKEFAWRDNLPDHAILIGEIDINEKN